MKAKRGRIHHIRKEYEQFMERAIEDVYSPDNVEYLFDDDELTSGEEGFLKGYLAE